VNRILELPTVKTARPMNSVTLIPFRSAAAKINVSSEAVARSWERWRRDWLKR